MLELLWSAAAIIKEFLKRSVLHIIIIIIIIIIKGIYIQDKNSISYVKKSQTVINWGPVW
jgi:hypothetical protein